MRSPGGARFFIETALAALSAGFLVLTLVTREWIELLFGVDPDGGDGSLEWVIAGGLLAVTVVLGAMARVEWRRPQTSAR